MLLKNTENLKKLGVMTADAFLKQRGLASLKRNQSEPSLLVSPVHQLKLLPVISSPHYKKAAHVRTTNEREKIKVRGL